MPADAGQRQMASGCAGATAGRAVAAAAAGKASTERQVVGAAHGLHVGWHAVWWCL